MNSEGVPLVNGRSDLKNRASLLAMGQQLLETAVFRQQGFSPVAGVISSEVGLFSEIIFASRFRISLFWVRWGVMMAIRSGETPVAAYQAAGQCGQEISLFIGLLGTSLVVSQNECDRFFRIQDMVDPPVVTQGVMISFLYRI